MNDERKITAALVLATLFLYINVSPQVGTIFSFMAVLYWISINSRTTKNIEIIKNPSRLVESLGIGIFVFVGWVILSTVLLKQLQPNFQAQSVFSLDFFKALSAQTEIPILSVDPAIRLITYGVIIPVIESLFFLSFALVFWAGVMKYDLSFSLHNPNMYWVAALVGATGSLFHLTVRIAQNYALFVDFLFFFISALLVIRYRQMAEAIPFHVLNNTAVLLAAGVKI